MMSAEPPRTDAPQNEALDDARASVYYVCIIEIGVALIHFITFWAVYGWTIGLGVLAFCTGWLGYQHLRSMDVLLTSTCLCVPLSVTRNMWSLQACQIVGSFFAGLSSVFAAIDKHNTARIFAILGVIAAIVNFLASIYGTAKGRELQAAADTDARMQATIGGISAGGPMDAVPVQVAPVAPQYVGSLNPRQGSVAANGVAQPGMYTQVVQYYDQNGRPVVVQQLVPAPQYAEGVQQQPQQVYGVQPVGYVQPVSAYPQQGYAQPAPAYAFPPASAPSSQVRPPPPASC